MLTPEEQAELEALEEESPDTSNLSHSEQVELAVLTGEEPPEEISQLEAFGAGARQGATLGTEDEAEGAIRASARKLKGDSREFTEIYEEERNDIRTFNQEHAKEHPWTYIGGEVAGGIGLSAISAGIGLPMVGLRAAMILGGAAGIGTSNKKGSDFLGMLQDAAVGAGLGGALHVAIPQVVDKSAKAFKGIGGWLQKMTSKSDPNTVKVLAELGESVAPEAVELEAGIMKTAFMERAEDFDGIIGSSTTLKNSSEALQKVPRSMKNMVGKEIDNVAQDLEFAIENALPEGHQLSIKGSLNQIDDAKKVLGTSDKNAFDRFEKHFLKPLKEGTYELNGERINPDNLKPRQLVELKRDVWDVLTKKRSDEVVTIYEESKSVSKMVKDMATDLVDQVNELGPHISEKNNQLTKLYTVKDLLPEGRTDVSSLPFVFENTGRGEKAMDLMLALNEYSPQFAQEFKDNYNPIISIYNASRAAREFNVGVRNLFAAEAAASYTEKYGMGRVGGLLALGKGGMIQGADAAGKLLRASTKVPRSVAGIIKDQAATIAKLNAISPMMAVALNDAIADGDREAIEQMAVQFLQNPEFSKFFEDGRGFEGKAATQQEIQQVEQEIKGKYGLRQQQQKLTKFRGDLVIPSEEEPVDPQKIFIYEKARDKIRKPEY